jgi:hypothetical protein
MRAATLRKEDVLDLVRRQPDEVDIEELIYQLRLRDKLRAAEEDVAAGRTLTAAEVRQQLAEWPRNDR